MILRRRSVAAKQKMAERAKLNKKSGAPAARKGTGERHPLFRWPISQLTCRSHKLVTPPEVPGNTFILLVGDSHLRAIADGFVQIPGKNVSFGIMCTPGAAAHELRMELTEAVVPRRPDAVCLLAPSNNLTASKTVTEAGADFADLITSACSRWPTVFVLDFPPRLTIKMVRQDRMRKEFCRVAEQMGVKYFSTSQYFPLTHLNMWGKDGVHLSDVGMTMLAQLICSSSFVTLSETPSEPRVPGFSPLVGVEEPATRPPGDPSVCTAVGRGRKLREPQQPVESRVAPEKGAALQQVLKKCFVPVCRLRIISMGGVFRVLL